ncbi:hypothetical protein C7B80_21825 [Cyanosarcina cf. burmensis CCALA 770]|nr:hypothetical protein C7B80_21825 [Cyanosarcina cf. burmensis CCALA 770]
MTLAQCKKITPDPLLAIATTCLGVAATTVTVGMYVGAISTSTPLLTIPKTASVPPVEPPPPKLFATIPATNLGATTPAKQVAAKLVEPTNPAQRTPQVQKGRVDPFAPLYSDEQTGQVNPAPQPLPPKPAPPQLELPPPPTAEVRQAAQYASRIILKGASEAEDGRSALVQLPGEPSPRFVDEGEIVKVGQGEVRFARIEDVDSSSPRIVLEENGVEVVRALGQRPTKRNSSGSPPIALNSTPQLHLQEPLTEAESPDSAIVPVPSLAPVGKSHREGNLLPSPPPLSDTNEAIRQKENSQSPALKPAKLGQQMEHKALVAHRSLQPAGVTTPARQQRAKLLSKLRQPRPPRPVSIQERQRHLQQHPPFLLPVTSHSTTRAQMQAEAGDKLPQFQDRRHLERRQLVRRLRQSSLQQPTTTTIGEQASSIWEGR